MMNQETFFCFGASMKMFLLNSFNKQAIRPQKPKVVFYWTQNLRYEIGSYVTAKLAGSSL